MTSLPGSPLFFSGDHLSILAVAIKRLVNSFPIKSFGQLALLSFAITDFTPAAYLRRSLRRPFKGYLILRKASYLDAFSTYPFQT